MNPGKYVLRVVACAGVVCVPAAHATEPVTFRSVVLSTDQLPTPEAPATINSLGLVGRPWATINDAGEVAFAATVGSQRGYWYRGDGPLGYLVQGGRRLPGRTTATVVGSTLTLEPQMSNGPLGAIYEVQVTDSTLPTDRRHALMRGRPGSVQLFAGLVTPAPGTEGGTLFGDFANPSAGPSVGASFSASVSGPNAGEGIGGLWRSTDGSGGMQLVARRGAQAPGQTAGVTFGEFSSLASRGESGSTIFRSILQGTGITEANRSTYWRETPSSSELVFQPTATRVQGFSPESHLGEISRHSRGQAFVVPALGISPAGVSQPHRILAYLPTTRAMVGERHCEKAIA